MPFDGVREGPLVCTPHSVRMILHDLKIHSRRVCSRPRSMDGICNACWFSAVRLTAESMYGVPSLVVPECSHRGIPGGVVRSPYGHKGDRLWVRESCRQLGDGTFLYRADHPDDKGPWNNVRFVPKRSARIWLDLLDVRIERLQAIEDHEVALEGVEGEYASPRAVFASLWDEINGKRAGGEHAWARNPWVWTLVFRRIGT